MIETDLERWVYFLLLGTVPVLLAAWVIRYIPLYTTAP
jgi:hypothetical protein